MRITKQRLAQFISVVFSPLIWVSLGVSILIFNFFSNGDLGLGESLLLFSVMLVAPLVFFFSSLKQGRFDWDLTDKRDRFHFYIFGVACGFLALNFTYYFSFYLFRLFLVFTITGLLFAIVTFQDKISLHVGSITSFFLVYCLLSDRVFLQFLPVIFLVGWSRVKLRRHQWRQVLEAFMIPVVVITFGFYLLRL
jgi:hypothetical protein